MPANASSTAKANLAGALGVYPARFFELGQELATDDAEWPLAQISEILDNKTCPLCRELDGHIVKVGDEMWQRYHLPSHINCRRIMVRIHKDEVDNAGKPTQPTLNEKTKPSAEIEKRYGHFITDERKYAALRAPARPTGRDFLVERGKTGEPVRLHWAPALPDWALRETVGRIMRQNIADLGLIADELISNSMRQVADQLARRAQLDPKWVEGLEGRSGLSLDEFLKLPSKILEDPGIDVYSAKLGKDGDLYVLFRGKAGERHSSFAYNVRTRRLSHIDKVDETFADVPVRSIVTKEEKANWLLKQQAWEDGLTAEQRKAFVYWSEDTSQCAALRRAAETKKGTPDDLARLVRIEEALATGTPKPGPVYRALRYKKLEDIPPGERYVLKSPQSATSNFDVALKWLEDADDDDVRAVWVIAKNKSGIDISVLSPHPEEEVMLRQDRTYLRESITIEKRRTGDSEHTIYFVHMTEL